MSGNYIHDINRDEDAEGLYVRGIRSGAWSRPRCDRSPASPSLTCFYGRTFYSKSKAVFQLSIGRSSERFKRDERIVGSCEYMDPFCIGTFMNVNSKKLIKSLIVVAMASRSHIRFPSSPPSETRDDLLIVDRIAFRRLSFDTILFLLAFAV